MRETISKHRKLGKDLSLPQLLITNIPDKIEYANISKEKVDVQKVQDLLDEINEEIAMVIGNENKGRIAINDNGLKEEENQFSLKEQLKNIQDEAKKASETYNLSQLKAVCKKAQKIYPSLNKELKGRCFATYKDLIKKIKEIQKN